MKNCYVRAWHLNGAYWGMDEAYITRNADGSWHVSHELADSRIRRRDYDTDAAGAQRLIDEIMGRFSRSRSTKDSKPYFVKTDITRDNVRDFVTGLMANYDHHAWAIGSYDRQLEVEQRNREILMLVGRISKAAQLDTNAA